MLPIINSLETARYHLSFRDRSRYYRKRQISSAKLCFYYCRYQAPFRMDVKEYARTPSNSVF